MIDDTAIDDAPLMVSADDSVAARDWFIRSADWIARGAPVLGALHGLRTLLDHATAPAPGLAASAAAVVGACSEIVLYALVGLTVAALVRALGVWAVAPKVADRGRALVSEGLLSASSPRKAPSAEVASRGGAAAQMAEIRRLIREHDWNAATDAVRALRGEHPGDPRCDEASDEVEQAMQAALGRFEAQLQAAREVNDPDQVLEIHGRMGPLLDDEKRRNLDVDLARWFLAIVHRRLRTGRIQADVVALADRIAENFGHTTDGASLRASLPTLRRSAGLCPRCSKPYTGIAQACPECLKPAPAPPPSFEPDELDEPPIDSREPDLFVEPFKEPAD